jgi:hypothetical protein
MSRSLSCLGGAVVVVGVVWVVGLGGVSQSPAQQPARAEQAKVNIEGQYVCVGVNPTGGEYRGVTRIAKERDAWRLTWQVGGVENHEGVGLLNGDLLSVSWRTGDEGGVVVYTVKRQGNSVRLEGKWTYFGAGGEVFDETLTKQ